MDMDSKEGYEDVLTGQVTRRHSRQQPARGHGGKHPGTCVKRVTKAVSTKVTAVPGNESTLATAS